MRKRFYTPLQQSTLAAPAPGLGGEDQDAAAPVPVIHNIVSTAQIDSTRMPMDLQAISEVLPGSSYDRRKFAAMTIRLANPSCTLLLFSSGKLVVTGGKNWYEGVLSCLRIARFLQRALVGVDFWLKSCNIQVKTFYLNKCASAHLLYASKCAEALRVVQGQNAAIMKYRTNE